jgi:ribosome-associated protein
LKSSILASKIAGLAQTRKASDIIIMNLRKLTSVTDYFVVCSADSDVQARAIADAVEEGLEKAGTSPWHREAGSTNWILLDYVDVVLHVFHKSARQFYSLERLWGDAEIKHLDDEKPPVKKAKPAVKRRTVGVTAGRKKRAS